MLQFLFPRLTRREARGSALFDAAVAEARQRQWYADLGVPDTIDGRFEILAAVVALVSIRLERAAGGREASAALTERFIEAMDAEHRQIGLGDPTLGKVVRKLVARLARQTGLWRSTVDMDGDWRASAAASIESGNADELAERLKSLWSRLEQTSDAQLAAGQIP